MKSLIQELKSAGMSGPTGRLPGHVVEVWVPAKNARKLERIAKSEDWWMYGGRRSGRGQAYYVRIEGKGVERRIEHELGKLDGEWRGRPGSGVSRKAGSRRLQPRKAA